MFPHAAHEQQRRPPRAFKTGRWHSRVRGLPETLSELPVATLADEMETSGEGQVRALLTIAGNPALTTPDAGRLDGLLAELELVICVDPYLNATTRHADVILPPPSVLEKSHYDLAFTALSVRNVAQLLAARLRARAGLAVGVPDPRPARRDRRGPRRRMPIPMRSPTRRSPVGWPRRSPTRRRRSTAATRTRSWPRSATVPPRSGCSTSSSAPGTAATRSARGRTASRSSCSRLIPTGSTSARSSRGCPDALATESGKVELAPSQLVDDLARLESALAVTAAGGMVLVGRRQLRTANSWTQNVQVLVRGKDSCVAQLHPDDAGRIGLVDGATATIRSAAGSIDVPVEVTDVVMPGVVCVPYGWGHGLPGTRQGGGHRPRRRQREHPHRRLRRRPDLGECRAQRHPRHRRSRLAGLAGTTRPASFVRLLRSPVSHEELEHEQHDRTCQCDRPRPRRLSRRCAPAGARARARRERPRARASLRPRPGDRRGGGVRLPRPVGRARERRDAARRARSAHAPLQRPSAADLHRAARRRAARRRLGRRHGRDRGGARSSRPGWPRPSACARFRSPTRTAPPTTPVRRSPPTTSSPSGRPQARCSRPRERRRRRSTR